MLGLWSLCLICHAQINVGTLSAAIAGMLRRRIRAWWLFPWLLAAVAGNNSPNKSGNQILLKIIPHIGALCISLAGTVLHIFLHNYVPVHGDFQAVSFPFFTSISSGILNWFSNFFIFSTKPSCPQENFAVKSIKMNEHMLKFINWSVEQVFHLSFISSFLLSSQTVGSENSHSFSVMLSFAYLCLSPAFTVFCVHLCCLLLFLQCHHFSFILILWLLGSL